jgi:deazaflavin-dependent oxidoreductase (nitroreductase family)
MNYEFKDVNSLPRPGTIVYDLINGTSEQKEKAIKKFKFMNSVVVPLYRIGFLPLLGFSRIFLLLETAGRKSGNRCITPLEYHRINSIIHIISARGEKSDWFKNLRETPDKVLVKLGFHRFKPKIEIIEDPKEKIEVLKWYVKTHPTFAKYLMGWNKRIDDQESGVLNSIANFFQIIKLYETKG